MRSLGFKEDQADGTICRWRHRDDDLILDAIPADAAILGFENRWQGASIPHAVECTLPSGATIRAAPPAYLLATKIEAFNGRGREDFPGSRDFGDMICGKAAVGLRKSHSGWTVAKRRVHTPGSWRLSAPGRPRRRGQPGRSMAGAYPRFDDVGDDKEAESQREQSVDALGHDDQRPLGDAIGDEPPVGGEEQDGHELGRQDQPDHGAGMGEFQDEPGERDGLHRRPRQRDRLPDEEETVVAYSQRGEGCGDPVPQPFRSWKLWLMFAIDRHDLSDWEEPPRHSLPASDGEAHGLSIGKPGNASKACDSGGGEAFHASRGWRPYRALAVSHPGLLEGLHLGPLLADRSVRLSIRI